jgi:hypothetical protein
MLTDRQRAARTGLQRSIYARGSTVRLLALVLLLLLIPAVIFGIVYVPRHDGQGLDFVLGILLPSAGIGCASGSWSEVPRVRTPSLLRRTVAKRTIYAREPGDKA